MKKIKVVFLGCYEYFHINYQELGFIRIDVHRIIKFIIKDRKVILSQNNCQQDRKK